MINWPKLPKVKLGEIVEFRYELAPRNRIGDKVVFTGFGEDEPYQIIGRVFYKAHWVAHKCTPKGYIQGQLYRVGQKCLGLRWRLERVLWRYSLLDTEEGAMVDFRKDFRLRWPRRRPRP